MKTRIISGVVGTVLLFAVLLCPWPIVFALIVAAAAAIAVYELLHNTGIVPNKVLLVCSMVFSAAEVLVCAWAEERSNHDYMMNPLLALWLGLFNALPLLLPLLYLLLTLVVYLLKRTASVWKGLALTLYATAGFAALGALRMEPGFFGVAYVLLPLVIAWMSDTGAYFVGTFFGKHKMAPIISPKKSWEGFFGGWVISVAMTALYGVVFNTIIDPLSSLRLSVPLFAVLAAVLAPLSVCGDLLASLIKRRCGIKDYGNIMPGHGGVMDRFDSVILIAPLLYVLLLLFA